MDTTITSINDLTTTEAAFVGGLLGSVMVIGLIVTVLLIIAGWRIFEKAGEKGWKILIPIYDIYILFKICGIKNWFWCLFGASFIISIMMAIDTPPELQTTEAWTNANFDYSVIDWGSHIPYIISLVLSCIISVFSAILISIKLAKAFGKGVGFTIGLILLPNIFTMILGFGKAKYDKKVLKN